MDCWSVVFKERSVELGFRFRDLVIRVISVYYTPRSSKIPTH